MLLVLDCLFLGLEHDAGNNYAVLQAILGWDVHVMAPSFEEKR